MRLIKDLHVSSPSRRVRHYGNSLIPSWPTESSNDRKRPPRKLDTPNRGPFRVIEYDTTRRHYTLLNLVSKRTFHIDPSKVHPYHYDPTRTDPIEVAMKGAQAHLVEQVLEVHGNPKHLKQLRFKVRWEGGEIDPEWIPYKVIRDSEALHQFLLTHPQSSFRSIARRRGVANAIPHT